MSDKPAPKGLRRAWRRLRNALTPPGSRVAGEESVNQPANPTLPTDPFEFPRPRMPGRP